MSTFNLTEEEKKKIREKHEELEKKEKQRKEDLKNGVAFKKTKDE